MLDKLIFSEYIGRTLVMQTDNRITCSVLVVFKLNEESNQKYIALLALDDDNQVNENLYLYRFDETDEGPSLENIQSDDEDKEVSTVLGMYLDKLDEERQSHSHSCGCDVQQLPIQLLNAAIMTARTFVTEGGCGCGFDGGCDCS